MTIIHFPMVLLAAAIVSGPAGGNPADSGSDPYAKRNGEAEALAVVERGDPARVYYRGVCGDRCALHAVGLSNCHPERFDTQRAPEGFFVEIDEASASSDDDLTTEQLARRHSAYRFAKSFNLTMFRVRKDDILKACPQAAVQN